MPYFDEFRINEKLLGKVVRAKLKIDLSYTEEEDLETKQFLLDLEKEKRNKSKNIKIWFLELITGKKLVEFENSFGKNSIREYEENNVLKPTLLIKETLQRPIDFGYDVNAWREYIRQEHLKEEQEKREKEDWEKMHKNLMQVFSETIYKKMFQIN